MSASCGVDSSGASPRCSTFVVAVTDLTFVAPEMEQRCADAAGNLPEWALIPARATKPVP